MKMEKCGRLNCQLLLSGRDPEGHLLAGDLSSPPKTGRQQN